MTTRVLQPPIRRRGRLERFPAALGLATATLAAAGAVALGPAAFAIPVGLALAVFLVLQPLLLLTLFVYVGLFKDEAIVQAVPFDVTLGLGLLLAVVCLYRLASGRVRPIPFGLGAPLAIVGVMLLVSLAWTPSPDYGAEKTEKFLTLTLLATLSPFFLIENGGDLRRLFSWLIVLALLTAGVALANPPSADVGRLAFGGESNTIGISQVLCTGALLLLLVALMELGPARWWALGAGLGMVVVAAAVGSRGPLLSLGVALLTTLAVWLLRVPRKVVPVLLVVVAGLMIVSSVPLPEASSERLARAVQDPVLALESNGRWALYEQALELVGEEPLRGVGAGGFQSVGVLGRVPENYPHNLFLELYAELGLAVMIVVVASMVAVLVRLLGGAWRHPEAHARHLLYVVLGVFLFNLFAAQVSGDINENRAFWAALGLAWMVAHNPSVLAAPGSGAGERPRPP